MECFYTDADGCEHIYYTNGMTIHVEDMQSEREGGREGRRVGGILLPCIYCI